MKLCILGWLVRMLQRRRKQASGLKPLVLRVSNPPLVPCLAPPTRESLPERTHRWCTWRVCARSAAVLLLMALGRVIEARRGHRRDVYKAPCGKSHVYNDI